ncbi:hypothetical protein ABC347_02810 [Sphingomonas sp. 1P06PA]|uniref:hypothetical protein n=1 Tax=Sphingomonas sp. 1P06PA TaxID=554121 RepID=UPI0039A7464E
MKRLSHLAPLAFAVALASCAADPRAYPSLAPRPVEALADAPERTEAGPPAAADPALEAEVAMLAKTVSDAESAWTTAEREAAPAIARAQGVASGSDAWVAGQQALSALDAARAPMIAALSQLDGLRLARAQADTSVDTSTLDALWARTQAASEAQATRYAELSAMLAG